MISLNALSAQPLSVPSLPAWRTPLREVMAPASARDRSPGFGLPSTSDARDAQNAMKKEMAAKRVEAVRQRRNALMLMVTIDPKAALKMTAELAKELKAAVKDYVDAGGRNVTDGEMALMRRDAREAREASDAAVEALPVEPKADAAEAAADAETADAEAEAQTMVIDAEMKRAQAAYAAAFDIADARDEKADRAEAVFGAALNDQGFFMQVKLAMRELKEARDKIKADWAHFKAPNKDDWKVADKAMAELEKAMDQAPTGAPEPAPASMAVSA